MTHFWNFTCNLRIWDIIVTPQKWDLTWEKAQNKDEGGHTSV